MLMIDVVPGGPEAQQEALALSFESEAVYRSQKADEYPDDARNHVAAKDLAAAATTIRALPADHPTLRRALLRLAEDDEEGRAWASVTHLGGWNQRPNGGVLPPRDLLGELAARARR